MPGLNDRAAQLLEAQHGVGNRVQLRHCGHTDKEIDGLVRRRHLLPVLYSVFRARGGPIPPEQAAMAAVLRCRPSARVTGPAALGLYGIDGFTPRSPIEVVVPPDRRVTNVPFLVRTHRDAGRGARIGPVPVAYLERCLVDAADSEERRRLLGAIDAAGWRDRGLIERLVRCARGLAEDHAGARRILELEAAGQLAHDSNGERAMAALFRDVNPPLEFQVWLTPAIRVDALWRDVRLVLEYLGRRSHGPSQLIPDANRHRTITSLAYTVEYIRDEDLRDPITTLARVLARRAELRARRMAG